jgi:hypothetical protein
MPARKPDGTIGPDSGPRGDDCKLRGGVSLRRKGGECDAATLLRALPGELLRNGVSKIGGYLANCWTTMALLPVLLLPASAGSGSGCGCGCGSGDLKGASIFVSVSLSLSLSLSERISGGGDDPRIATKALSRSLNSIQTNTVRRGQSHFINKAQLKLKKQANQTAMTMIIMRQASSHRERKTRRHLGQKRRKASSLLSGTSLSAFYFGLRGLPLPALIALLWVIAPYGITCVL